MYQLRGIESRVRRACEMYGMIEDGDSVAVGVSGGKDSVALLCALAGLRRYLPQRFELCAFTLDPCFGGVQTDYSRIADMCRELRVPYSVKRTDIGRVVFEARREKNPCSLCARMRRGVLHDLCVENGAKKLALGHHMNDVVETFFLNLFHEGRVAAFSPVTYLTRKDITVIRPLVMCTEREVEGAVASGGLPVVKSLCPEDGKSERQAIKAFIEEREREYPHFLKRTFTALTNAHVSGL